MCDENTWIARALSHGQNRAQGCNILKNNETANDEFIHRRSDPAVLFQYARDTCSLKANLIGALCVMIQIMKANSLVESC